MADEGTGTETGTVETTTGQVETTTGMAATGETLEVVLESGEPTLEALQTELANAQRALKRASAESMHRKKKLEAHDKAEAEREKAKLSEVEKAQKAAQEWEEKHKTLAAELSAAQMRQAFYDEADTQKLSFVNAQAKKDAFTLADVSSVVTDEGELTGMDAAVKALTKSHPHLFGTAQAAANVNATDTGGGAGKATDDQLIEYAARVGIDKKYLDPSLVAQAMQ